jgi:hypothetical protein
MNKRQKLRIFWAVLLSPLAAPIALTLTEFLVSVAQGNYEFFKFAAIILYTYLVAPIAFVTLIVIGLPVVQWHRARGIATYRRIVISAILLGAALMVLVLLFFGRWEAMSSSKLQEGQSYIVSGAISGGVVAASFLALSGRPNEALGPIEALPPKESSIACMQLRTSPILQKGGQGGCERSESKAYKPTRRPGHRSGRSASAPF